MNSSIIKLCLTGLIAMLTVGCANISTFTLDTDFKAAPIKTETRMSVALQCMSSQLDQAYINPNAYVFMVRDIIDGTVKDNDYTDGPMSDSGRIQMISTLSAHTSPSYALVIDRFPLMFKPLNNEAVGLDRFGYPSQQNLDNFYPKLTAVANANRLSRGMANVGAVRPLIIDGAFTRNDSAHMRSKGYGNNGGYRGDSGEERSAALDYGESGSERSVTLVVNIIDPESNLVIGTQGFDLKYYSNSKTARFRFAVNSVYYGFSNTDVHVETLHAAQQTLLDGAAIWILDNAYGSKVDLTPCFDSKETIGLGRDARAEDAKRAKAEALAEAVAVAKAKVKAKVKAKKPTEVAEQAVEVEDQTNEDILASAVDSAE
jgi:hypothetical protein